jgi:hypothetical protein
VKGRIDRAILETLVEAGEKATAKVEAKAKAPDGRRDRARGASGSLTDADEPR